MWVPQVVRQPRRMKMKVRLPMIASLGVVLATFGFSAYEYPLLPEIVPIHWNALGKPDGYGSKNTLLWMMPGILIVLYLLMLALPKLSPKKFEIDTFRTVYDDIVLVVMTLMAFIHYITVMAAINPKLDFLRLMIMGMCVFFALLGNLMGKVRRNFYVGIRTPWTLASTRVWDATHRIGAKFIVGSSIAAILLTLVGVNVWVGFSIAMAGLLWPVVLSFLLYKKWETTDL